MIKVVETSARSTTDRDGSIPIEHIAEALSKRLLDRLRIETVLKILLVFRKDLVETSARSTTDRDRGNVSLAVIGIGCSSKRLLDRLRIGTSIDRA